MNNVAGYYANPSNMQIDSNGDIIAIVNGSGGGGGSGTVTSIIAGTGLSGGTITTTGTISISNLTRNLNLAGPGYYNVVDFGAACTGGVDDTAAIQLCINTAQTNFIATVLIPSFTLISNTLSITGAINLIGHNIQSCVIICNNPAVDMIQITPANANATVSVRRLKCFYSTGISNSGTSGIRMKTNGSVQTALNTFEEVAFANCANGIWTDASAANSIRHCLFDTGLASPYTGSGSAITITNTVDADNGGSMIKENNIVHYDTGIKYTSSGALRITDNYVGSTNRNLYMSLTGATVDLVIANNNFENSNNNCIELTWPGSFTTPPTTAGARFIDVMIANNEIQTGNTNSSYGLLIGSNAFLTGLVTISGNAFQNSYQGSTGTTAVGIFNCSTFSITANTFDLFTGLGSMSAFHIDATASNGSIGRNAYGSAVTLGTNVSGTTHVAITGQATLTAGTVTVTNGLVTTSSLILASSAASGVTGALRTIASTGTFTITSSNSGDSGVVNYIIY